MDREVKPERSFFRDEKLSLRHRQWGFDCPATDIDFLLIEYDHSKARAIIEYKNEQAAPQLPTHPTYRAIRDVADRSQLPFFAVRYTHDLKWFRIRALNELGKKYLPAGTETLSEREFVAVLYALRDRRMPADLPLGQFIPPPLTEKNNYFPLIAPHS